MTHVPRRPIPTIDEVEAATIETRTEWVCPGCGDFAPHFGAINVGEGGPYVYQCYGCATYFKAPVEG